MQRLEKLMMKYDYLLINDVSELPDGYDGWYSDNVVLIDKAFDTRNKLAIFHEEIAHHHYTYGNIAKNDDPLSQMFENKAQYRAMEDAIPLSSLVEISKMGMRYISDIADYFELPHEYVAEVLKHYKAKYGLCTTYGNYLIYFNPLHVKEVE